MKKIFLLSFIVIIALQANAQDCVDPYASQGNCGDCQGMDFNPVCGCDNKNYRNECEAFNCANLLQDSSTICDYVEFEFRPTLIASTPGIQTSTTGKIAVYMKYSGTAVIQIYNVFGKVMFEVGLTANSDNVFLPGNIIRGVTPEYFEIPDIASFENGVYIVAVTANGQIKAKKILKM